MLVVLIVMVTVIIMVAAADDRWSSLPGDNRYDSLSDFSFALYFLQFALPPRATDV
jgi:hypothetical protein